jgi:hypothetical protein
LCYTGKSYCREIKPGSVLVPIDPLNSHVSPTSAAGVVGDSVGYAESDYEERGCPAVGVVCEGGVVAYTGHVWHDLGVATPNCTHDLPPVCTRLYTCTTNGCPERGATTMACKPGYTGPICAVCTDNYYASNRDCVASCAGVKGGVLLGFVLGVTLLVSLAYKYTRQYRHRIHLPAIFSHLKIAISFYTLVATMDTQFGVIWPAGFASALDLIAVLCLDFSSVVGSFCIGMSYYQSLLSSTLLLLATVIALLLLPRLLHGAPSMRTTHTLQLAVYLLLFAYPIVSGNVVAAFACHAIEGEYYLRADYSVRCYTPEWYTMAVYAAVWLVVYVALFPVYILAKLMTYRGSHDPLTSSSRTASSVHTVGPSKMRSSSCTGEMVDLRFLLYDYKSYTPVLLWEGVEMVRSY